MYWIGIHNWVWDLGMSEFKFTLQDLNPDPPLSLLSENEYDSVKASVWMFVGQSWVISYYTTFWLGIPGITLFKTTVKCFGKYTNSKLFLHPRNWKKHKKCSKSLLIPNRWGLGEGEGEGDSSSLLSWPYIHHTMYIPHYGLSLLLFSSRATSLRCGGGRIIYI